MARFTHWRTPNGLDQIRRCVIYRLGVFALSSLMWIQPAYALTGWEVVSGDVTVENAGDVWTITSGSDQAIVQWQTFNVGQHQTVNFLMPGITSSILNRILGGEASHIAGQLNANGTVLLMNPAGINIANTAAINTGAFIASTLNLSNTDYLSGNWFFSGDSLTLIENHGTIQTAPGGYVVLAGGAVNNTGNIFAPDGTVHLAVGDEIQLNLGPNHSVELTVDDAFLGQVDGIQAALENTGTIDAHTIELQARLAESVYDHTINNQGVLRSTLVTHDGASIKLLALNDDQLSQITHGGVVDVSDTTLVFDGGMITMEGDRVDVTGDLLATGGHGGQIHVLGDEVAVYGNSTLDVSGETGGGEILIGGDYQGQNPEIRNAQRTWVTPNVTLKADAYTDGDGGKVIAWADGATSFYGTVQARGGENAGNGGFVEVSGKEALNFLGNVDTTAPNGELGTLLLDPTTIIIIDGGGGVNDNELLDNEILAADPPPLMSISEQALEALGAAANVRIEATDNITLQDLADNTLSMAQNAGSFTIVADADNDGVGDFTMDAGDTITTAGGALNISGVNLTLGDLDVGLVTGTINLDTTADSGTITVNGDLQGSVITIDTQGTGSTVDVNGNVTYAFSLDATTNGDNSSISFINPLYSGVFGDTNISTSGDNSNITFQSTIGLNMNNAGDVNLSSTGVDSDIVFNSPIASLGLVDTSVQTTGNQSSITYNILIPTQTGDMTLRTMGNDSPIVYTGNNFELTGDRILTTAGDNSSITMSDQLDGANVTASTSGSNSDIIQNPGGLFRGQSDATVSTMGIGSDVNMSGVFRGGRDLVLYTEYGDAFIDAFNHVNGGVTSVNANVGNSVSTANFMVNATTITDDANKDLTIKSGTVTNVLGLLLAADRTFRDVDIRVKDPTHTMNFGAEIIGRNIYLQTGNNMLDANGALNNFTTTGNLTLDAGGVVGTFLDALEINVTGGNAFVLAGGIDANGVSVNINGSVAPVDQLTPLGFFLGLVCYNGSCQFVQEPPETFIDASSVIINNNDDETRNQQHTAHDDEESLITWDPPYIEPLPPPVNDDGIQRAKEVDETESEQKKRLRLKALRALLSLF